MKRQISILMIFIMLIAVSVNVFAVTDIDNKIESTAKYIAAGGRVNE